MSEFTNTDAELTRCIKSRLRHEYNTLPNKDAVREYVMELVSEIINEEF